MRKVSSALMIWRISIGSAIGTDKIDKLRIGKRAKLLAKPVP